MHQITLKHHQQSANISIQDSIAGHCTLKKKAANVMRQDDGGRGGWEGTHVHVMEKGEHFLLWHWQQWYAITLCPSVALCASAFASLHCAQRVALLSVSAFEAPLCSHWSGSRVGRSPIWGSRPTVQNVLVKRPMQSMWTRAFYVAKVCALLIVFSFIMVCCLFLDSYFWDLIDVWWQSVLYLACGSNGNGRS